MSDNNSHYPALISYPASAVSGTTATASNNPNFSSEYQYGNVTAEDSYSVPGSQQYASGDASDYRDSDTDFEKRESMAPLNNVQRSSIKKAVPTKLFIGNIARGTSADDLKLEFEKFGRVAECTILSDYGFVHFNDANQAETALIEMNGKTINGRNIKVEKSTSFVRKRPNDVTDLSKCYVCGGEGHWAKDCQQLPAEERERQYRRARKSRDTRGGASGMLSRDHGDEYGGAMKRPRYDSRPDNSGHNYAPSLNPRDRGRPPLPPYYDDYDGYYYYYYRSRRPPPPPPEYYDYYGDYYPPARRPPSYGSSSYGDYPARRVDPLERPPPEYYERRSRLY